MDCREDFEVRTNLVLGDMYEDFVLLCCMAELRRKAILRAICRAIWVAAQPAQFGRNLGEFPRNLGGRSGPARGIGIYYTRYYSRLGARDQALTQPSSHCNAAPGCLGGNQPIACAVGHQT